MECLRSYFVIAFMVKRMLCCFNWFYGKKSGHQMMNWRCKYDLQALLETFGTNLKFILVKIECSMWESCKSTLLQWRVWNFQEAEIKFSFGMKHSTYNRYRIKQSPKGETFVCSNGNALRVKSSPLLHEENRKMANSIVNDVPGFPGTQRFYGSRNSIEGKLSLKFS